MYLNLLLPLLLAGGPAEPPAATADDPPIQIWIDNDGRFLRGDRAKVHVRADEDGYLVVLHADTDGHLRVLFPIDPTDDNFVRGGKKYEVEGRGGRDAFDVGDRSGRGTVYAAVGRSPFRFDQFVLGDHWDYKALEPQRLSEDPEPELTDLVRRMAGGSFDYDVMSYYVVESVVYANDYSYHRPYYDDFSYGGFGCGYYSCGSGLSVSLFFGRPFYRRHYYSPFHYAYDPFYDPFFYDPWYYRPYRPYYYRPVHYYPRRHYWGHPYYYRTVVRPYTPYRFRDRTLVNADYRDRRYTFGRAVNTVHTPPISRFTEPDNSSPVRRAVDRRERERPEATVARRPEDRSGFDDRRDTKRTADPRSVEPRRVESRRPEPRNESSTIEARRARPRETPRATTGMREHREPLPVDLTPRRSTADRPRADRPAADRPAAAPEARRAPVDRPRTEPRSAGRSSDPSPRDVRPAPRSHGGGSRGGDGGGRVQRSPSPPSGSSWSGGGGGGNRGGGGGGGSVSSGGSRRR
jgi:Domain of unknown function (DUF4384)